MAKVVQPQHEEYVPQQKATRRLKRGRDDASRITDKKQIVGHIDKEVASNHKASSALNFEGADSAAAYEEAEGCAVVCLI